ncbi:hypothetical protein ACHAPB_004502 [Verticillium nonalfalfae]
MGGALGGNAAYDAALERRQALMGASGARALVKNFKVARIAAFACIGGVLYGYNQGMFSGILAMPSFGKHMDGYIDNPTLKGWLTAILELGAWFGTLLSGFVAEVFSRKYGVLVATAVFMLGVIIQITSITGGHESILAAIVLFVGMMWMPFSPRWLIHHDREDEARDVLANLRDLPHDHELIQLEFLEIKAQSLFEKRSIAEHFPHLQEQTAWNIFKLQFVSIKTTGVVGVAMFIATIPAVLWIDRVGRKPVLTVGAIGMGTCHIIIAIILAKNIDNFHNAPAAGWAAVCMVWLFVIHFGYSWGPCAWIIVAEIWPLSTRPYGVSLGASSNWMNNFIVGQVTPDMLVGITYGTYIIFGLLIYTGAAFVWFFVPETKRLSLEEMDLVFGSEGTAQADFERMAEINRDIGLTALLERDHHGSAAIGEELEKPKIDSVNHERV